MRDETFVLWCMGHLVTSEQRIGPLHALCGIDPVRNPLPEGERCPDCQRTYQRTMSATDSAARGSSPQANSATPWRMNEGDRRLWAQLASGIIAGLYVDKNDLEDLAKAHLAAEMAKELLAFGPSVDFAQSDVPWTGHARVELMGHRSYLGRVREIEAYGSRLGEVQELLASGEYGDVHLFGGKSVYEIQPIGLEDALAELRAITKCITCSQCYRMIEPQVTWQHPLYNEPKPLCDDCKAGKAAEEPDLPFESDEDEGTA